jgi:hypothetical protein
MIQLPKLFLQMATALCAAVLLLAATATPAAGELNEATVMGWKLLPTYVGHQPMCRFGNKPYRYTATDATARGTADGQDAVARAGTLGLLPGSALYADVEHYDRTDSSRSPRHRGPIGPGRCSGWPGGLTLTS